MINPKRNGMLFNNINPARHSVALLPKRDSAPTHKSPLTGGHVSPNVTVTYKNFQQCNGLLFSLLLHAPAIELAAQEDAMWAIHNWRTYGVKPSSQNVGAKLTLQ